MSLELNIEADQFGISDGGSIRGTRYLKCLLNIISVMFASARRLFLNSVPLGLFSYQLKTQVAQEAEVLEMFRRLYANK